MNLWVDDLRDPEEWVYDYNSNDWQWARNFSEACAMLESQEFDIVSLDHDLGDFSPTGKEYTGYDVALFMWREDHWPKVEVRCHSANPVGRENIFFVVKAYRRRNEKQ